MAPSTLLRTCSRFRVRSEMRRSMSGSMPPDSPTDTRLRHTGSKTSGNLDQRPVLPSILGEL